MACKIWEMDNEFDRGTRGAPWDWGVLTLKTRHSPYVTTPNSSRSNNMVISRGYPQIGRAGPGARSLRRGRGWHLINTRLLTRITYRRNHVECDRCWSNGSRVYMDSRRENWALASRHSRSLEVIGIDTDRCGTAVFLLTFHSNRGPASYRFQDIARYWAEELRSFPDPRLFYAPFKGIKLERA